MTSRLSSRLWVILGVAIAAPAVLRAGANVWTGSRLAAQPGLSSTTIVASYAGDPDIVYSAQGASLFRSTDGGLRWTRMAGFDRIDSVHVSRASASTVSVGGRLGGGSAGIFRSTDGGATWTQTLQQNVDVIVNHFDSSAQHPDIIYAASLTQVYRSDDAGATWTLLAAPRNPAGGRLFQTIAALLIDPSDGTTPTVGGSDSDYPGSSYYYPFNAFIRKSADSGQTWADLSTGLPPFSSVNGIAIDPSQPETVFAGLGPLSRNAVYRSADGGATWTSVSNGLPFNAGVRSLAMDPQDPHTLYAGTGSGVYRTRDSGASWFPFGQQLGGVGVDNLSFDARGRLWAGTFLGASRLDVGAGAVDVAAGNGRSHVLSWSADSLTVRTLEDAGGDSSTPPEGPSLGWLAAAIADGADGLSRVLWVAGDGRAALEVVGSSGSPSVHVFPAVTNWSAVDVSVGADGNAHVLWTSVSGATYLASVDAAGNVTLGTTFGPFQNWTATAVTDGPDGSTRVLWRATDGRFSISLHQGPTLGMHEVLRPAPVADRSAEDIAVGSDGLIRVLLIGADDVADVATVGPSGTLSDIQSQSPGSGWAPRRISAGPDGLTRLLFSDGSGAPQILLLNPDNRLHTAAGAPNGP
jgi:photosystem II stability/assembly factor-like uncharacterized protein